MTYLTEPNITAAITALYGLFTIVGILAPKGSRVGLFCAKFSADLKGHMTPAGKP